ncbi:hypothetical protein [Kingella sp. (in: b-proteobacteria)]|uniref:hypothetical protein n=1 Tax=Kingella sp. (in: b-proteobacteria) TaxID=2020713 RepID=UPI0026DD53F4|nr:hypothetical protein [Kingella sp. (in: b-proteobacteria)]MDO4658148.1 hypothetical protein [Kingella sp. (in: b-proteobacteria)]
MPTLLIILLALSAALLLYFTPFTSLGTSKSTANAIPIAPAFSTPARTATPAPYCPTAAPPLATPAHPARLAAAITPAPSSPRQPEKGNHHVANHPTMMARTTRQTAILLAHDALRMAHHHRYLAADRAF